MESLLFSIVLVSEVRLVSPASFRALWLYAGCFFGENLMIVSGERNTLASLHDFFDETHIGYYHS